MQPQITPPAALPEELRAALVSLLGEKGVSLDAGVAQAHAGDWSDTARQPPALVLFPETPQQVAQALGILARFRQPVVVQGGLTGLAGGATPQPGEVALSLARLDRVEDFDSVGGTVTVQAGVVLEQLQAQVEAAGWFFPLDLGARGSCQVGGNAATNAGGNRVIRYGTMRELVLGVEVALADGRLLTMLNRVTKNTTGVDLKHLFIGSEGTLGVITRLVLKLSPRPLAADTALCAVGSFEAAARLLKEVQGSLPTLSAFELMWDDFMQAAIDIGRLKPPFPQAPPLCVLVETMGASATGDRDALEQVLQGAIESGLVDDAIVSRSIDDSRRLWRYRETVGEMLSRLAPHAAFDVGIPMAAMDGFVASVRAQLGPLFPTPAPPVLRPSRRRQPACAVGAVRHAGVAAPGRGGRLCGGGAGRRLHLGRARHRQGEEGVPAPEPVGRRAAADARPEVPVRPAQSAQCGAHRRRGSATLRPGAVSRRRVSPPPPARRLPAHSMPSAPLPQAAPRPRPSAAFLRRRPPRPLPR